MDENNKKSKTGLAVCITVAICLVVMAAVGYGCYAWGLHNSIAKEATNLIKGGFNGGTDTFNKGLETFNNVLDKVTGEINDNRLKILSSKYMSQSGTWYEFTNDGMVYYENHDTELESSKIGNYIIEGNKIKINYTFSGGTGSGLYCLNEKEELTISNDVITNSNGDRFSKSGSARNSSELKNHIYLELSEKTAGGFFCDNLQN